MVPWGDEYKAEGAKEGGWSRAPEFEEFGREVGTVELGDGDGEEDVWAGGVWGV